MLLMITTHLKANSFPHAIVIAHTGNTRYYIKALVIYTCKENIQLTESDLNELRRIKHRSNLTRQDKEEYINFLYDKIIVDSNSYKCIIDFILSKKGYFVDGKNQKNAAGVQSYEVIYNGNNYVIFFKKKLNFFDDLKKYLVRNQADRSLIRAIVHIKLN